MIIGKARSAKLVWWAEKRDNAEHEPIQTAFAAPTFFTSHLPDTDKLLQAVLDPEEEIRFMI